MRHLQITVKITNRESVSNDIYFSEIGKTALISNEEEVALAQKIRSGDSVALDRLVKANLRFVVSVAKKYQHQGLPLGDLINEGNLGLIKAANRFDETRGFKFISFAVWWIRQSILEALRENTRMIRLPANHVNMLTRIKHLSGKLENELERQATPEELAESAGISVEKINDARYFSGRAISYDTPVTDEDSSYSLIDKLCSPEPEESLTPVLNRLTPCERTIIQLAFGFGISFPMSNPEIGKRMNMSAENVRLIRNRALAKLKGALSYAH